MGVQFNGFSNISTKPVPKEYRSTIENNEKENNMKINKLKEMAVNHVDPDIIALFIVRNGITFDYETGTYKIQSNLKIPTASIDWETQIYEDQDEELDKALEEFEKSKSCNNNLKKSDIFKYSNMSPQLVDINWNTNIMYYTTKDTKNRGCSFSYSHYNEFITNCQKLCDKKFNYVLCDTNCGYDYGLIQGYKVREIYPLFKSIRDKYTIKELEKVNVDKESLDDFVEILELSLEQGIIQIC